MKSDTALDLYRPIHKALRSALFEATQRLGRFDFDDPEDLSRTLDQAEQVLALMVGHMKQENDFLHTAIEARLPGGAHHATADHQAHLADIAGLGTEIDHLRGAAPAERDAITHRLYLHFSRFVGEKLEHMVFEETRNNATLWSLYSDEELRTLRERMVAGMAPGELKQVFGWMARALNPTDLETQGLSQTLVT